MFSFLFKKNDKKVMITKKPIASDAAPTASDGEKRRPGRTLTEDALKAHDAVASVLTDAPQTRGSVIAQLAPELQGYVNGNWQNIVARLVSQNKAKLAEGSHARGRAVSYVRA
jgi:hypothetical protein